MPVNKTMEHRDTEITVDHMELREVVIIADDPSNFRLQGNYAAFKDAAARASGSGALQGMTPEVLVKHADMSAAVKAAIATILAAIDASGVADAGVTAVAGVPAVEAVEADPGEGIEAVGAVPAVRAVRGVPPGPLHGGTVV